MFFFFFLLNTLFAKELPKFEELKQSDSSIFNWFNLLFKSCTTILPIKGISKDRINIGPVLRGIIKNVNISMTVSNEIAKKLNKDLNQNATIEEKKITINKKSTSEAALNKNFFKSIDKYFNWEPITGYTLTEGEWSTLYEQWNGILTSVFFLIVICKICPE